MKKFTLIIALVTLVFSMGWSQNVYDTNEPKGDTTNYPYWIEMMQNPDANVFETVDAFEKYWENRPDRKGNGYNPFKRWEWYIKHKMNPDGSRLAPDHDLKAYEVYQKSHLTDREFSGDWENIGPIALPSSSNPYWGNGRINGIAFHPTNADVFYVGAPAGGLWKTEDAGQNWETLTDWQPTLGVSSIVVDYSNPFTIYIGSGDRDSYDAAGMGVFKSTDGGQSWVQRNNGMGNVTVGRLIQHPTNSDVIYASSNGGIFKSTDAGYNWTQKKVGNFKELLFKPDNPSVLYAVRRNWGMYRSTDDGENWQQITSGIPSTYRAVIGVSPSQPDYVYFLATESNAFNGLYRSVDGGDSFELRSDSPNIMGWDCDGGEGGQAWYNLDIAVDPLNAEIIYSGGINCWKSIDGGQTWEVSSNWEDGCGYPVHPDIHVFEYNPLDVKLYVGNDGGVWWTDNGGTTWNRIVDGLAIGQQYKLGQSNMISNHIVTGFQDNGISTYHTDSWVQSEMQADGMECAMDIADTTLGYGCAQFGWLVRRVNDSATTIIAGQDIGGINELGDWVTPFCQHNTNPEVMFLGYQNLWRTNNLLDENPAWNKISNGTGTLLVLEHSAADENVLYFATIDGFYRSDNIMDGTPGFSELSDQLPDIGTITDIVAHPWNQSIVYITQHRKVFKSEDKGLSWEDISGSLPNVNLNDLAFYKRNNIEGLYVASNVGVFFKDEYMEDWVDFSNGLPAAILATEIEIFQHGENPALDRVRISTYGRGLWGTIPYHYQPTADFESSDVAVPTAYAVDFYDKSAGYPQSWSWTFEGGDPSSSSSANPVGIVYNEEGVFEVSLTVTNSEGADTKTIAGYVMVNDTLVNIDDNAINTIRVYPNPVLDIASFSSPEITSLEIYDMMGRLTIRRLNNKIDMTGMKSGVYFVIGFDKYNKPLYKGKIIKK